MSVDVSLVSSGHDVGDARLHRLTSALAATGLSVEVLATGSAELAPPDADVVVTVPRGGMKRRLLRALIWPWRAQGSVIIVIDPDLVPSAMLSRARGKLVVVDVHEDYSRLLRDRAWASGLVGLVARALTWVVTWMSSRGDLTVVADDHVPPLRARTRMVLRNTPYSRHLPGISEPDQSPRALHIGDLRLSRGLFDMLDVIEAVPNWRLDLVGPVASADEEQFQLRIQGPQLAGRVRWYGRRPPQQAWSFAVGAWVGLSMLHDTPAFRDAIPSKVYEFISCGLPVVGSDLPRQAELIERTGAGVVVTTVSEAITALANYESNRELLIQHRQAAQSASFSDDRPYVDFAARVNALCKSS